MLCNTADNGTVLQSIGNLELQQFIGFRNFLTFQYGTYANIQFHEVIELNVRADGVGFVAGFLIGLLCIEQLLYLCFDNAVLYFFEQ